MNQLLQTASSRELKVNPAAIYAKAEKGPVMIISRAETKGVFVSATQWNATAAYIAELEQIIEDDRRFREMDQDPSMRIPFTLEEHAKRGLIDG